MRRIPFYPLLLALVPSLFLYAHNREQASPLDAMLPATTMAGAASLLFAIIVVLARNPHGAAIVTAAVVVLFSWYDIGTGVVRRLTGLDPPPGIGVPLAVAIVVILGLVANRWPARAEAATRPLNIFAVALLALLIVQSAVPQAVAGARPPESYGATLAPWHAPRQHAGEQRDIYYIVLDGYAREDVLRDVFDYDNSAFAESLRARGFVVGDRSRSNYALTFLSLASTLNGAHLTDLGALLGTSRDRAVPYRLIQENRTAAFLREQGYAIVNFSSGWGPTNDMPRADSNVRCGMSTEFADALLRRTAAWPFLARGHAHASRRCLLESLGRMPEMPGPKFVFAHQLVPHPPYVFGPDGERVPSGVDALGDASAWLLKDRYVDQLRFVSAMTLRMIDTILARTTPEPIIVLQSDHGSATANTWDRLDARLVRERMPILSAIYLPGTDAASREVAVTPINTFPMVLNRYFRAGIALQPDASFFSSYAAPYAFTAVDSLFAEP